MGKWVSFLIKINHMKKIILTIVVFFVLFVETIHAQSVRINFIKYKQIEFSMYTDEWDSWPSDWDESGAYAIIENLFDETYDVSIYGNDDSFLVSSICTFDPTVTSKKRDSSELPYLNCYSDDEGDQVWTNVVSLGSLLENVEGWEQDDAQLYLWVFSGDQPFAFVFE